MSGDHPFEAYVGKLTEFAALRVDILTSSQQVIESSHIWLHLYQARLILSFMKATFGLEYSIQYISL